MPDHPVRSRRGPSNKAMLKGCLVFLGLAPLLLWGGTTWFTAGMTTRSRRVEVPQLVGEIKTAQLAYDAAFDTFVAVPEPVPRPIEALGKSGADWIDGTGFETLGWVPDGRRPAGTYMVELKGETDFVVHGWMDIDGDGEVAHFTATKTTDVMQLTDDSIY